jgi:hypothetical protein
VTDSRELEKHTGSVYFPINNKDQREKVRKAIDTYGDIEIVVTPGELRFVALNNYKYREIERKRSC